MDSWPMMVRALVSLVSLVQLFFNIYGYIANSQSDQLPDGLIAQYHRGHGVESHSGLNFFRL